MKYIRIESDISYWTFTSGPIFENVSYSLLFKKSKSGNYEYSNKVKNNNNFLLNEVKYSYYYRGNKAESNLSSIGANDEAIKELATFSETGIYSSLELISVTRNRY